MTINISHARLFRSYAFSILFTLLLLSTNAVAQKGVPQFKDYPATDIYKGQTARLQLTREDKAFRTRLTEAAKEKPNFAGHYILTTWGCGAECMMGAAIDARTGKVYWWNFSVCCWGATDEKFEPISFRRDSKLIVFSGLRNEKEGDDGAHFYKFENGRFVHLRSTPKAGSD
jgi:hypothetical protein